MQSDNRPFLDKAGYILEKRYDERIDPKKYDSVEIHGVMDARESGTLEEVNYENPDYFSVYLHETVGGVECVGDFGTWELANDFANDLGQRFYWPVYDFVNPKFQESAGHIQCERQAA